MYVCISLSTYRRRLQNNVNAIVKGVVVVSATVTIAVVAVIVHATPATTTSVALQLYCCITSSPPLHPQFSLPYIEREKIHTISTSNRANNTTTPIHCSPIEIIRHFGGDSKKIENHHPFPMRSRTNVIVITLKPYWGICTKGKRASSYSSPWRLQSTGQSNE